MTTMRHNYEVIRSQGDVVGTERVAVHCDRRCPMYVSTLHTDNDAGWQQYELDDPTWDQVAAAIKALDSARKTLVMLAQTKIIG
jgi:hypothetical protein